MLHTLAYSKSTDATADVDITPVQDDIISIVNSHFFPQKDYQLLAAAAIATTILRAKIVTPTLRQISPPFIRPVTHSNLPITLMGLADYRHDPLTLKGLEEIQVQATQSAAGPTQTNIVLFINDTPMAPPPQGNIITMRGTATNILTANVWTSLAMTWADFLPAGNYACIGLQVQSATGIAARMIFEGQVNRPGCIAQTNVWDNPHPMFRLGNLGVFGYFNANRMPTIQVLANVADTSEEVYLDLVRVG